VRVLLQRVSRASVSVRDELVAEIGPGLLLLVGIGADDGLGEYDRIAEKVVHLRVFDDEAGVMNRSLADVGGQVLVVPQFTLYGDVRHGRRPDFAHAAPPDVGRRLFDAFCGVLRGADANVAAGRFGANMRVEIEGDGPVTIVVSTDGWAEGDLGRKS
jgi:D-tyrosyl-tRNA(Tyr) deacylase